MKNKNILVLGAHGMLGRAVFLYLSSKFPGTVWATVRDETKDANVFYLSVDSVDKDFKNIYKKIRKIDYIINCIAVINKGAKDAEFVTVNSDFPKKLVEIAEKYHCALIHVSTDGVFDSLVNDVCESDIPLPVDRYGKSKFSGEQDSLRALSIRTSILGFDPNKTQGLLEWSLKVTKIAGFTNQLWSGCTVLQFAELMEKIISRNAFYSLRKKSSVFHFAPLYGVTKYLILKEFLMLLKRSTVVRPLEGTRVTRQLKTNFSKELFLSEFSDDLKQSLKELIEFEKIYIPYRRTQ